MLSRSVAGVDFSGIEGRARAAGKIRSEAIFLIFYGFYKEKGSNTINREAMSKGDRLDSFFCFSVQI
jgi:hypothetical protein